METLSSFRQDREGDWTRLDTLIGRVEKGSIRRLSDDDLLALPILYRATLSALSVARETSLDRSLVVYLEALSARAYFIIYGARRSTVGRIWSFFARDWPTSVAALWPETLVACLLMAAGTVAGFLLVANDPAWYTTLIPSDLAGDRNPAASTEALRDTLYGGSRQGLLGLFATFLFTHNADVAILAFALGFAFGVPTSLLLVSNGATLGAFLALFASHNLAFEAGGWLMIHGTTELFAIAIAGAAGFHIGRALVFPGRQARIVAAAGAGRKSATVMVGVIVMLAVAGLLEGIGRQVVVDDSVRYAIAATALLSWLAYFYAPRGNRHGG